ncbi:pyridoxal phosphate-dependent aminotransferase [Aestuariispira insulae]|uniref:Aminotransferase n=1 Tax=Aestuariispira insulae TaxID=1461337 RepID=A0A3D9HN79_9PROT|nr:pyridoxal phosphate-dependent aminotransferase [Aestuariispira insulae]RED50761.1 aspartate aminotransferase [Aestuariispira insulae]
MPLLSSRVANLKPSLIQAVVAKSRELRAAGHDVIDLSIGEPDFDTPDHIKKAAIDAINAGHTGYTAIGGLPALRAAIADKFQRENSLAYDADMITIGAGGKQIIYNAFLATLEPGDEVLIPAPFWTSYPDIVTLAGGTPVITHCPKEDGFKLTAENLARSLTPKTKWVMLNSPSNPTGAAYSAAELEELAGVLRKHPDVWVLSDDIYEKFFFEGHEYATMAKVAPDLFERTVTMNGVSKAYAMTGWRLGYAGAPKSLAPAMRLCEGHSTTHPCVITQHAAIEALNGPQDCLDHMLEAYKTRKALVVESLNAIEGITCLEPAGAFYAYPDIGGLLGKKNPEGTVIENDTDFALYLLESAHVGIVQGAAFGLSPNFRLSFAASTQNLENALDRIAEAVAVLKP